MNPDDHLQGQPRPTAEQAAWVFRHLNEHYAGGGSFRHLIYQRMGFGENAYGVLVGQGQHLSNLLNCAKDSPAMEKALLDCYL